jgi:hypothetical protein
MHIDEDVLLIDVAIADKAKVILVAGKVLVDALQARR